MVHPEILLLPVLMVADYYLTILGASLREKIYGKHLLIETYEMNPHYRGVIDAKSKFNLRFAGQVFINTLALFLVSLVATSEYEFVYQILLGFYLTLFAYINGLHISNLLTFMYVNKQPEVLDGSVRLAHSYLLRNSLYSTSAIFFPVLLILIFSFTYFALGAMIAIVYKAYLGVVWIFKDKKSKTQST